MNQKEQERDLWLQRFYEGKCGLADLIYFTMQSGAPATPQILELYVKALNDYADGDDLEQVLGLSRVKAATVRKYEQKSRIQNLIEGSKLPLSDPTYYDKTAFHEVAEKIHLSPSRVYDIYRGK